MRTVRVTKVNCDPVSSQQSLCDSLAAAYSEAKLAMIRAESEVSIRREELEYAQAKLYRMRGGQ